jgi:glutamate carboxypeptidase
MAVKGATKTMPKRTPSPLLRSLTAQLPEMVSTVRRYVEQESPSTSPDAIASLVSLIASDFATLSPRIRQHNLPVPASTDSASTSCASTNDGPAHYGPALQIDFPGPRRSPRLLLLGHADTVYPLGTLRSMPWREHASHLSGPGVFDMKAGIVQALFALKALLARGPLPCSVTILLVPDEEIGSPASRGLTERLALRSSAVLVLEPAAGSKGACKTSRKGIARYTLHVHGVAAHAGLDFERGASAIVEAAHQVVAISGLSRPARGLTLNPGLISGGTRPNVVADLAEIVTDVRFLTASQAARVHAGLHKLQPHNPRCSLQLLGGVERGPFERSKATVRLYRMAAQAADRLGFQLAEAAVGGGSDGNLTAALGVPTLDGLGAVGDGAHAPREFVVAREMPRRSALLAELMAILAAV